MPGDPKLKLAQENAWALVDLIATADVQGPPGSSSTGSALRRSAGNRRLQWHPQRLRARAAQSSFIEEALAGVGQRHVTGEHTEALVEIRRLHEPRFDSLPLPLATSVRARPEERSPGRS